MNATNQDMYAGSSETTGGKVFTVTGQDWDSITDGLGEEAEERVVVNMGPQHPVDPRRAAADPRARGRDGHRGPLRHRLPPHRHREEHGVPHLDAGHHVLHPHGLPHARSTTRPTYALGVERLLDIEDEVPEKAQVMRVLLMELNRISSHLVCIATGGMEIGALTVMTIGFRERELVLDLFELITGLRMNHAFIRPGGVAQDLPPGALDEIRDFVTLMKKRLPEYAALCNANPIFKARLEGVGHLDLSGCLALGITGPVAAQHRLPVGPAQDPALLRLRGLRLRGPDLGHRRLLRPVPDPPGRDVRVAQDRRAGRRPAGRARGCPGDGRATRRSPGPASSPIGSDGMGNSLDHIRHIMGESMEALIHHFKLVTEGFRVPVGQAYVPIESPRGELGAHVVSDGGTRPFRAHFRDPSFTNLQATSVMSEGGMVADVIVAIASIDPVMGGVDR